MTICVGEPATCADDTYWVEDNAALPVLLIDDATQAITEALYRIRCGSGLNDRDLTAAGIALGDLVGGLSQLAHLLATSVSQRTHTGRSKPDRYQMS